MKICWIDCYTEATKTRQQTREFRREMSRQGIDIVGQWERGCKAIVCGSVGKLERANEIISARGGRDIPRSMSVPLFIYNWDLYSWIWDGDARSRNNSTRYDWHAFGELCRRATEVWCPSECTVKRTHEYYDQNRDEKINAVVVKSCANYFSGKPKQPGDYVLNCMRRLPDPMVDAVEEIGEELQIPCVNTNHKLGRADYERTILNCRFLVSAYQEASTGGLSILEGYYHGKPTLMSDSPWHGGRDYLGHRAYYFDHTNRDSLRDEIASLWSRGGFAAPSASRWIEHEYSYESFCRRIAERLRLYA